MNYLNTIQEIKQHRSSTKVKMRQLLAVLEELDHEAKEQTMTTLDDEEVVKAIHELYADFHYSYPSIEVVTAHKKMIDRLKNQFSNKEAFFFPYTAILQGYASNHDIEDMEALKTDLLTTYPEHDLTIYHAIFSGLNIHPDQALLKTYYQAILTIEPKNEEDAKHLEAIHEIYESLIWKKK